MTNDYGNLELHTVLLYTMKDIDKICRDNGLRYYLHAGTLLGAANHKGFIPWDDDVDISLMRDDYEKLIEIISKDFSDKYFVQNYKTDPEYHNNRTVLRVIGTKLVHYHEDSDVHTEIGVDIVPLDAAPNSKIFRKIQQYSIWFFDMAAQICLGDIIPVSPIMKCVAIFSKLGRVRLGKIIDKIATMYNKKNTEYVGLLTYTGRNPYTGTSGYDNDLMPRKWFLNPSEVEFEDTKLMAIEKPELDLEHRYGPHWAEPYPEEKRITKHDIKAYEIEPALREKLGL